MSVPRLRTARTLLLAALLSCLPVPAVGAAADTTPPVLGGGTGSRWGSAGVVLASGAESHHGGWFSVLADFDESGSGLAEVAAVWEHEDGRRVRVVDARPDAEQSEVHWVLRYEVELGVWTLDELRATDAAGNWSLYRADGSYDDSTRPCGDAPCTRDNPLVGVSFTVVEEPPNEPPEGCGFFCQACHEQGCGDNPPAMCWEYDRFRDVCPDAMFRFDITEIALEGITFGCNPPDNDRFCPTDPVTRGQLAAFLVRAMGLAPSAADRFVDDDGSVHESSIQALAAAGITRGCNPPENDRFCPTATVTRAEMASMLTRALGLEGGSLAQFVDVSPSSPHRHAIAALGASGITRGCNPPDNDRFCPADPVTREQMAAFMVRAGLA